MKTKSKLLLWLSSTLLLHTLSTLPLAAEDKSASREGLITLPSAGGTVQKESGSFGLQANTGSTNFTLPLPALPARGGFAPSLAIQYSQYAGDSGSGMGIGWSINSSAIEFNQDKGSAIRGFKKNGDFFNPLSFRGERLTFLERSADGNDLVYELEASETNTKIIYHSKAFTVTFMGLSGEQEQISLSSGFEVRDPSGMRSYYSGDAGVAEGDFGSGSGSGSAPFVSKWPLVISVNPAREAIRYQYEVIGGRSYLKRVLFAGGASEYRFDLIDTKGSLVSYQKSYRQSNNKLFSKMTALYKGAVHAQWCLAYIGRSSSSNELTVRADKACLEKAKKDALPALDSNSLNILDQLHLIYRYGNDTVVSDNTLREADIKVAYSSWTKADLSQRDLIYPAPAMDWAKDVPAQYFELADLNMDSLVDIVQSTPCKETNIFFGSGDYDNSFKNSKRWSLQRTQAEGASRQIDPLMADNRFHFADINGDGYVDFVEIGKNEAHVYVGDAKGEFAHIGKAVALPSIDPDLFDKGQGQFTDLNMDGLSDIITTIQGSSGETKFVVYLNLTSKKSDGSYLVRFGKMEKKFPFASTQNKLLSQKNIRLVDINGDRLPDLIDIRPAKRGFCVYENKGNIYSSDPSALLFGHAELTNPICDQGYFIQVNGLSEKDNIETMWYLDVNGDGIVDFANMGDKVDQLKVWTGLGDGSFSNTPLTLQLNSRIQVGNNEKAFKSRTSDLDGDGQSEIIVFQEASGREVLPVVVIDFNRMGQEQLVKANLLTTLEYSSGLRYDIRYSTSTDELLRDRKRGLVGPNTSTVHFPVVVAKQIVTSEKREGLVRLDAGVEEILYHRPYYDPIDKRFIGFASVEHISYGDESRKEGMTQRSLYSSEIYYTGESSGEGPTPALARKLAGKLQSKKIYSFTPNGTYAKEVNNSSRVNTGSATLHSLSRYAKEQDLPKKGTLLESLEERWSVVAKASSYYLQQNSSEQKIYDVTSTTAAPAISKTSYSEYDSYNYPHRIRHEKSGITGMGQVTIPAVTTEVRYDYDESRAALATRLGIFDKPSSVSTYDGQENLLKEQLYTYYPQHGKLLESKTLILPLYDHSELPSAVANKISAAPKYYTLHYDYDRFGNRIGSSDSLGKVESVAFDSATGTFPVKYSNAMGHTSYLLYGGGVAAEDAILPPAATLALDKHVAAGKMQAYSDILGKWSALSYDSLGRRVRLWSSSGSEDRYSYKMANNFKPTMIKTSSRRYSDSDTIPAGESRWIEKLQAYNPAGEELASYENAEKGGGRVLAYSQYNRNKKEIFKWIPYTTPLTVEELFQSGEIPSPFTTENRRGYTFAYDELGRQIMKAYVSLATATGGSQELTAHKSELSEYYPWGEKYTRKYHDLFDGEVTATTYAIKRDGVVYGTVDALGHVTSYERNILGTLTAITLPGESSARLFGFNNQGKMEYQVIPGVGSFVFDFDLRGNLTHDYRLDTDGKLQHERERIYDNGNRLQKLLVDNVVRSQHWYDEYPAELPPFTEEIQGEMLAKPYGYETRTYTYDGNGLFNADVRIAYNTNGSLLMKQMVLGGEVFSERYAYTLDGLAHMKKDSFNVETHFRLGPSLKLIGAAVKLPWASSSGNQELMPIIEEISYTPEGLPETIDYRKGAKTQIAYDPQTLIMNRVQSSYEDESGYGSLRTSKALQDLEIEINTNGAINKIVDNLVSSSETSGHVNRSGEFHYNLRNELISAKRFGEEFEYEYTPAGHFQKNSEFLQREGSGSSDNNKPYSYNQMGQLISGGKVLENRYNGMGELVYTKTANNETLYGYDSAGLRVYKKVIASGKSKLSLYPLNSLVIEPSSRQTFVFIGNIRLARIEHYKKNWFYFLKDHLKSSDIVMTADGLPVEQMLYKPYGSEFDPIALSSEWKQHLSAHKEELPLERTHHRFTGQYLDDDSGLYYLNTRYYDPVLGRFITPDFFYIAEPERCVRSSIDCNLYSYAANNPLSFVDPNGQQSAPVDGEDKDAGAPAAVGSPAPSEAAADAGTGESSSADAGAIAGAPGAPAPAEEKSKERHAAPASSGISLKTSIDLVHVASAGAEVLAGAAKSAPKVVHQVAKLAKPAAVAGIVLGAYEFVAGHDIGDQFQGAADVLAGGAALLPPLTVAGQTGPVGLVGAVAYGGTSLALPPADKASGGAIGRGLGFFAEAMDSTYFGCRIGGCTAHSYRNYE
ncbi:MAG: VCBS repeat-containing protein [Oligoflexia bacterium]|nr:VCBS repeat-containing protein [Oligoflexia bacterium]